MELFDVVQPRAVPLPDDLTAIKDLYVWVEEKYNGHRLLMRCGEAYRRSRKENEWSRLPRSIARFADDEWVDGELYVEGRPASDVASLLAGNLSASRARFKAFYRPEHPTCDPWVQHERLRCDKFDVPFGYGRFTLAYVVNTLWPQLSLEDNKGFEGLILKPMDYPYGPWFKLKRKETLDVVVIGFKYGAGKYLGQVGSLRCRLPDGKLVSVSGMTDEVRSAISLDDLGRTCEIDFQDQTEKSAHHPRFIRWRDDL